MMPEHMPRQCPSIRAYAMHGRTDGLTEKHVLLRNHPADSVTRTPAYADFRDSSTETGFATLAGARP